MRAVQKISCINGGGFTMSFDVEGGGKSKGTDDNYTNPNYKTVDMKSMGLPEGTEVHPKIAIDEGDPRTGPSVSYSSNGQDAVYAVTGTTFDSDVQLIGGGG